MAADKPAYIHRRKKRYMAIILDEFEETVEPQISPEAAERFKGLIRQKLHALALDAIEMIQLPEGTEINHAATELRESLENGHENGRRPTTRSH
jgi:hypothetical protein